MQIRGESGKPEILRIIGVIITLACMLQKSLADEASTLSEIIEQQKHKVTKLINITGVLVI